MTAINEFEEKVISAFNIMWGHYPEPAMLIHKSKTIVAANQAGLDFGRRPGEVCANQGAPESHNGCLANQALADQRPMISRRQSGELNLLVYWLPVVGYPDYYVHFSVGAAVPEA